ncbi:MAG: LLM class flavin-dependent oxidoreductase [Candidatus Rokubacteria bacterium]|nr:LLM class flavin-dependent oxidoreductase [Candidatus Rokubacteria bacterium]
MRVPVGLNVWSRLVDTTFPYFDQVVAPFDSLWLPDHVQYNGHNVAEGWTLLVWALARYPDKLAGHEVLCNSFRNPAHTAKMVATAQALSGGRVVLGIGAGWNKEEYLAYGWPYPATPVRIDQMCEAIGLIRRLWSEPKVSHAGAHYQVIDAVCAPRPTPVPPVMIGGHGEKYLLRAVATHADWWNYGFRDAALYAHKQDVLKAHCREARRDYDAIVQVIRVGILIAETERELERLKQDPAVRPLSDIRVIGTPDQVTDVLRGIIRQGARRLTVNFADAPRPDGTRLFAEKVLPALG